VVKLTPEEEEAYRMGKEVEAKLELDYPYPSPRTREEWLKFFEVFVDKLVLLEEVPEDYKVWGLTWLMEQLLGFITCSMDYSYTGRFDGHSKWTVWFKKGEF